MVTKTKTFLIDKSTNFMNAKENIEIKKFQNSFKKQSKTSENKESSN